MADAGDEFIVSLIYHNMWDSDACWKTVGAVTEGLRKIPTKGGKIEALKDNIRIRWKGLGWKECETKWQVDGHVLTVAELTTRLKQLIRIQVKHKWVALKQTAVMVLQQKEMACLGKCTQQVKELDRKAAEQESIIEANARLTWKKQEDKGIRNMHSKMQQAHAPALVKGLKIMYYSSVEMDEKGDKKEFFGCLG